MVNKGKQGVTRGNRGKNGNKGEQEEQGGTRDNEGETKG